MISVSLYEDKLPLSMTKKDKHTKATVFTTGILLEH